jgi:hypothetical protein
MPIPHTHLRKSIGSNKTPTLTQIQANNADSLGSFRYKQATPRPSVVTTITTITRTIAKKKQQRYNVYWKQVGGQIRKSTCLSHEDATKKQEEFRVLDEAIQGGVDNNKRGPESTSTKRKGNYIGGPGRGNRRSMTTKSSLSVHKDKVFLQEIGAFINDKTKELSTSENVPTDISIQSQVLSKVIAAAKHNQDATMSLLLSKAGIFVFFFCAQNRSQNSLRRSRGRENSFLLNCVLHV